MTKFTQFFFLFIDAENILQRGRGEGEADGREEDGDGEEDEGDGGEARTTLGQTVGSRLGPGQEERWIPAEQQRQLRLQR